MKIDDEIVEEFLEKSGWPDDPWFLREEDFYVGLLRSFRVVEILLAVEQLKRLYPREVCRSLMTGGHKGVLSGLVSRGIAIGLPSQINVGLDLFAGDPWHKAKDLVAGLIHPENYIGHRLELELWATLARNGIDVEYEQGERGKAKADLRFEFNGKPYVVEAKVLNRSKLDRLADDFNQALIHQTILAGSLKAGSRVTIKKEIEDRLAEAEYRDSFEDEYPKIVKITAEELKKWIEGGCKPERFEGTYAIFESLGSDKKYSDIGLDVETSPEGTAIRAARALKRSKKKFNVSEYTGAVFIDLPKTVDVNRYHEQQKEYVDMNPSEYKGIQFTILRYKFRSQDGRMAIGVSAFPLPGYELSQLDKELSNLLCIGTLR